MPVISRNWHHLFRHYYALRATFVPCERLFSASSYTVNKLPASLTLFSGKKLVCLKDWSKAVEWLSSTISAVKWWISYNLEHRSYLQNWMRMRTSYLPLTKEVNAFARICLSVCLLARLLKNACMDLDEMLRVFRCRDMDELINIWARSGL